VRGSRLVHGVSTTYFDEALGVPAINLFSTLSTASLVRTPAMDLSLAGSRPEPREFLDLTAWAGTPPGGLWSDHLAPLLGFVGNELGEVGARAPLKRILDLKNREFFHTFIAEMHFMRR
jgi:hypothetical protein